MNIHTESESEEEGPEYSWIVKRGRNLWSRLTNLEYKYTGLVYSDGLYSRIFEPSKKSHEQVFAGSHRFHETRIPPIKSTIYPRLFVMGG